MLDRLYAVCQKSLPGRSSELIEGQIGPVWRSFNAWRSENPEVISDQLVQHSVQTSEMIAGIGLSIDTVLAGLLHHLPAEAIDFVLPTENSIPATQQIVKHIRSLQEVTSLWSQAPSLEGGYSQPSLHHAETMLRSIAWHLKENPHTIFLLLCSCLEALETAVHRDGALVGNELNFSSNHLIFAAALERYFLPFPHLLRLDELLWRLQDTVFVLQNREAHESVENAIRSNREERERIVNRLMEELQSKLDKDFKKGTVHFSGRAKGIFSLFDKSNRGNVDVFDLVDLIALRAVIMDKDHVLGGSDIVDPLERDAYACYRILESCLSLYTIVPKKTKDYIHHPRPTGYRAFHVGLFYPQGNENSAFERSLQQFELQIRTEEMHREAEFGEAAHWKYKLKEFETESGQIDSAHTHSSGEKLPLEWFLEWYKDWANWFAATVIVRDREGHLFTLPNMATAADAAYKSLGNLDKHPMQVRIEHPSSGSSNIYEVYDLNYRLGNWERIVSIDTFPGKEDPSAESWLVCARTPLTRQRVSSWLRSEMSEETVKQRLPELGEQILTAIQKETNRRSFLCSQSEEILHALATRRLALNRSFGSLDELLTDLAEGKLDPNLIVRLLYQEFGAYAASKYEENKQQRKAALQASLDGEVNTLESVEKTVEVGLIFGDIGSRCYLAQCCLPIPGDQIAFYYVRPGTSRLAVIHQNRCPKVIANPNTQWLRHEWLAGASTKNISTCLEIHAADEPGMLRFLTSLISVNIRSINTIRLSPANAVLSFQLEVENLAKLEECARTILKKKHPYIYLVERFPVELAPVNK